MTDLRDAIREYEAIQTGLGWRFFNAVDATIARIQSFPSSYQLADGATRRAFVHRFPFAVYYCREGDELVIDAIFDTRRDPESRRVIH